VINGTSFMVFALIAYIREKQHETLEQV